MQNCKGIKFHIIGMLYTLVIYFVNEKFKVDPLKCDKKIKFHYYVIIRI